MLASGGPATCWLLLQLSSCPRQTMEKMFVLICTWDFSLRLDPQAQHKFHFSKMLLPCPPSPPLILWHSHSSSNAFHLSPGPFFGIACHPHPTPPTLYPGPCPPWDCPKCWEHQGFPPVAKGDLHETSGFSLAQPSPSWPPME